MSNITIGNQQVPVQDYNWVQAPQPDPSRSLNLAASDPLAFGGQVGSAPANADATQKFGTALTQMLQRYQQMGTHSAAQVQQGQLNYSDAGIGAQNAQLTSQSLQGYNPSTIMNAGNTASRPFETASQGLGQVGQTFNEQLGNFGNILNNANTLMQQQQTANDKAQASAQGLIHDAMSLGSDALTSLIQTQPNIAKIAGYDTKTLQGFASSLKAKEDLSKQQFNTIHSSSGSSAGFSGSIVTGGETPPVVSPTLDAAVADIIKNNPKEWGHAADAIDAQFGKGTASKYDAWLKAVYGQGQTIDSIYQPQQIGNLRSIDLSRLSTASNRIVTNYVKSLAYTAVASAVPYIQRLAAAQANPGSVSDADLLDSLIKINTGGGQITEAQARLITQGRSVSDTLNVLKKKSQNGGILSDSQRQQAFALANQVFKNYQNAYTPVYKQATAQLSQAKIPQSLWTIPDWNTLVGQITTGSSGSNDYNAYLKAIGQ